MRGRPSWRGRTADRKRIAALEARVERLEAVIARLPVLAHWLATYGEAQASEDHGKG